MKRDDKAEGRARKHRRPYVPPAVEESAEFETLAMGCGKLPGPSCSMSMPNAS